MENDFNNASNAIMNLKHVLNVKNDSDIAEKLHIANNTISGIKKRNSVGALFEKIIELKNDNISLDSIFKAKKNEEIEFYLLCSELFQAISENKQKIYEYKLNLKESVDKEKTFSKLFEIIQSIKGKDFFVKFLESWHGKGERMLVVFYLFLKDLCKKDIDLKNTKENFMIALNEFIIPNKKFSSLIFTEKDKNNLVEWANQNLDDVSCFEIINSTPVILSIIKDNLNFLNKYTID